MGNLLTRRSGHFKKLDRKIPLRHGLFVSIVRALTALVFAEFALTTLEA